MYGEGGFHSLIPNLNTSAFPSLLAIETIPITPRPTTNIWTVVLTHTEASSWMKLRDNQKEWLNRWSALLEKTVGWGEGRWGEGGLIEGGMKLKLMWGRWKWRSRHKTKERVGAGMERRIEKAGKLICLGDGMSQGRREGVNKWGKGEEVVKMKVAE